MHLITGAAGFIGSAYIWQLNQQGTTDIIIVDNLGVDTGKWRNLAPLRFADTWTKQELLNRIDSGTMPELESIVHLGACSATTETDHDYLLDNNYRYSVKLAQWAVDQNIRFVYASSAAVYGDGNKGFDDNTELTKCFRPLNMYGYSKQLFDMYALRQGWLNRIAGVRFFNVFGPNEYHKGSMISMAYRARYQLLRDGHINLFKSTTHRFTDGNQVRDFIYVKDAVRILRDITNRHDVTGIYNVGTGLANSWNDLATAVCNAANQPVSIRYIDMPENLMHTYQSYTCADMTRLATAGVSTETAPLQDAIRDYVQNYLPADSLPHCLEP